ncbi:ubiquitin-conjugating enzyme/RWD-like protein [Tanacetum coccineum]
MVPRSREIWKSYSDYMRERDRNLPIFSMKDVLVDQDDAEFTPMATLDNEDVRKRYQSFKRFDSVMDYSYHLFSARSPPMKQATTKRLVRKDTRRVEDSQGTLAWVYETRIDLLRAAIIEPEGTPYHDGLFVFDVWFPRTYPIYPPLVKYHSSGLVINPNISKCGEVRLKLPKKTSSGEEEEMWVPFTSNLLQLLVSIQGQILNRDPVFNEYHHSEYARLLDKEDTLINSLKTMVYIMNKPPKNFEELVVGPFRNRVRDILMACEAYIEGREVGCFVKGVQEKGDYETCTIVFRNDVASCVKPLVTAFYKIGAKEAVDFLPLSQKKLPVPKANEKDFLLESYW